MTLRSLSKNVEILPESSGDELIIRLSEAFSERLKGWVNGNPKAAAALLKMMLYDSWGAERCPRCGETNLASTRFCQRCGEDFKRDDEELERMQGMIRAEEVSGEVSEE